MNFNLCPVLIVLLFSRYFLFVTVAEQTLPATWAERWQQADKLLIVRQQTTLEQQRGYLPTDTAQGDGASIYAGSPHKLLHPAAYESA